MKLRHLNAVHKHDLDCVHLWFQSLNHRKFYRNKNSSFELYGASSAHAPPSPEKLQLTLTVYMKQLDSHCTDCDDIFGVGFAQKLVSKF